VLGVHVNAVANAGVPTAPGDLERLSEEDRKRAKENEAWWYGHSGYATQMATRPQTLAYALNDSPAGQLAWNLEWFVDWDPTTTNQTPVDRDAILTNVTIFWLTGTAGSAARLYLEAGQDGWGERPEPSGVPTAVANFRGDHAIRGLAALSNTITRWTEYDTGGHFASLQAPEVLVDDIREFFRGL
jgi:pimeloyl-ACP methyl ester carboxylesterase